MRELSLFTGGGGGLLGGHLLGWTPVCCVEWEPHRRALLKARQRDGLLPADMVIERDVFAFDGHPWRGKVDIVTGGFPCQPFSRAGKGLADNDARNGWPATLRIITEVAPPEVFLENVAGLVYEHHEYFKTIIQSLSCLGYCVSWRCVSAGAIGAPHERSRVWIYGRQVADAYESARSCGSLVHGQENRPALGGWRNYDGGSPGDGCISHAPSRPRGIHTTVWRRDPSTGAQPSMGRVVDGVPLRLDRLEALGNAQVPQVVAAAYLHLSAQVDAFLLRMAKAEGVRDAG